MRKVLKDYIDEGYTIVVSSYAVNNIKAKHPMAMVVSSRSDGIGGTKLLVDKFVFDAPAVRAALPKYKQEDVVFESFTEDFVNKESTNSTVKYTLTDAGVPNVTIDGKVIPIVSASFQYVTDNSKPGAHLATFTYLCEETKQTKFVTVDSSRGEIFFQ